MDISLPLRPAKPRSGRGVLCSSDRSGPKAHHRAGRLTSANRGCPGGHVGPTTPSAGRRGTVREFVQSNSCRGVRCGAIHIMSWGRSETIPQLGVILPEVEWSRFRQSWPGARGLGPIRAPDSGDDASLRGGPPAPHRGVYKRRIAKPSSLSLSLSLSHALDLQLAFSAHSLLTPPSSPARHRL